MTKALKKALDDSRDHINGGRDRHALALILGILKRLADNPGIEQPIAPEPPEVTEPAPVPTPLPTTPPPTTKPV